ncbi:MAG: TIGR02300 family protein [Pseudomonadota bacterium]
MSKQELGVKRDCPECGARFYDLNKEPAHCPKCEHDFIPEALLKPRKTRAPDEPAKEKEEDAKPEAETSLEDADQENKAATSTRKAALDEESDDDDDGGDDIDKSLAEFEDVDLDDDDDDESDNSLLVDDDDDDDVAGIVVSKDGDDDN